MISYILRSSCYFEIWALCVSWITDYHKHFASCFACWALFGSLVPAMWNRTSCAQVHEFPQSYCGDNREGTFFLWLHIYYPNLASVRFEHSVCRGSLLTTTITLFALLVEQFLVHWYQQCETVHHVSKCMSFHKAIVVITGRTYCFDDYIYITFILLLLDLITLCVLDHLWPLVLHSLLWWLSTLWFICTSNVEPYIMCPSAWVATKPLS